MKPRVCILKADGTNCDKETAYAFTKAGALVNTVLVNHLRDRRETLDNYQIMVIPGGFSYGDDVAAGKVLATELLSFLKEQLEQFLSRDTLILGICNGFQVLVRMGLLPFNTLGNMQVTLTYNDSGNFECRWITMIVEHSPCIFTQNLEGHEILLPVAHGEGKLYASETTIDQLKEHKHIPLRYSLKGKVTDQFPHNPNGSLDAIAGMCDKTGRIFGLMPHPERFTLPHQYHNWRRQTISESHGMFFFKNAVAYFNNHGSL
jgi:phosphoribosylformylglycinamidine synthase I